jgi:Concanavalin A-like lectin/glucanases superfamily/FIVAR domain
MKRTKKFITVAIIMIAVIAIFQSCKKSSSAPDYNSDKSALTSQIDSATTLYSSAVEGKQAGDYTTGSKATLKASIDLANGVKTGSFTQQQVNNALANLKRAEQAFDTNLIQEISPENLVAYWKFSGDATDASGNGHNGTLKTNYVGSSAATATDGGTVPVLVADRYGIANSAYFFNNGAYIEIPYDQSLYPSNFTITCWVKPQTASNGNYIFSVDHYFGYKFQLQGNNFPFLTISTDSGIHDVDDNPGSVQLNTWSQIIASFTNGAVTFYINGVFVKTVAIVGNLIPPKTIVNVCIGNELPKSAYNFTDTSDPNYFYGASYFMGAIDDVRLYNKVLSAAEVNSLYVMESPN